jgi:aminoglycoside phosphotransferase
LTQIADSEQHRGMPTIPPDDAVPALPELLSDGGRGLLSSLAAERGLQLSASRIAQIRYDPGSSAIIQFRARMSDNAGTQTDEIWVATSGLPVPQGALVFGIGDTTVALWRYPDDPHLPGLAPAADPARIAPLLEQLGARPGNDPSVRLRAYRPGRRAVLEVNVPPHRLFVKVVRPAKVAALQSRHELMAEHVPVPHTLGWSDDNGIVVLQAMPGQTLRHQLEEEHRASPSGDALQRLLDALPTTPDGRVVAGPIDRLPAHVRLLSAVLPTVRDRLTEIAARIGVAKAESRVPVHGDFHASQILVDNEAVVGLVDVDTSGSGERSNDMAILLGQLATIAAASRRERSINRYGRELLGVFEQRTSPAALRRRVAAAIVGFATGPFRVQHSDWPAETIKRLALAERWLASLH